MMARLDAVRTSIALWGLLVLLLGIPPATASAATAATRLHERIDLDLEDAMAEEVFAMFAQVLRAELELDPEVKGEVTIRLINVTARTALTAVCEGLGCRWQFETGEQARLRVEAVDPEVVLDPTSEPSVTVELRKVRAEKALRALATIHGIRVELEPGVEGEISASLRDRNLHEVLDDFCRQIGCRWTLTEDEDRTTLHVVEK